MFDVRKRSFLLLKVMRWRFNPGKHVECHVMWNFDVFFAILFFFVDVVGTRCPSLVVVIVYPMI